jgi:hypothetical protein
MQRKLLLLAQLLMLQLLLVLVLVLLLQLLLALIHTNPVHPAAAAEETT